jgi:hypothetical protein
VAVFVVLVPFTLRQLSIGFGIALVVGAALTPLTLRLEARHLAEREADRTAGLPGLGDDPDPPFLGD